MSPEVAVTIASLRSLHIPTERDRVLTEQLDHLLQTDASGTQIPVPVRFTGDLETRGITFIEAPGGGKTTAARKVLSSTTALNPVDAPPLYLHAKVPSPLGAQGIVVGVGMALPSLQGVVEPIESLGRIDRRALIRLRRLPRRPLAFEVSLSGPDLVGRPAQLGDQRLRQHHRVERRVRPGQPGRDLSHPGTDCSASIRMRRGRQSG